MSLNAFGGMGVLCLKYKTNIVLGNVPLKKRFSPADGKVASSVQKRAG